MTPGNTVSRSLNINNAYFGKQNQGHLQTNISFFVLKKGVCQAFRFSLIYNK